MDICLLGLVQEAPIMGERAITRLLLLLQSSTVWWLCWEASSVDRALGLWGEARLQTPAWSCLRFVTASFFILSSFSWSLFPNPLGLHKCATWFLKKASFFSLIIKLPRNNGCHLKQQLESSFPTTHRHCHLCSTSKQLGAPGRSLPQFFPALHCKLV